MIEGIESVETKYFVIFNADGSFDPNELKLMFEKITNENADLVFELDMKLDVVVMMIILLLQLEILYLQNRKNFFKLNLTDILYTYVLGKTKLVNNLKIKNYDFSYCIALPITAEK